MSKGSFYWHFANHAELVAAALALWEQRETTEVIGQIRSLPGGRAQLVALGRAASTSAARGNGHAAVLASASDPLVAPVLRVTRTRLEFLSESIESSGHATSTPVISGGWRMPSIWALLRCARRTRPATLTDGKSTPFSSERSRRSSRPSAAKHPRAVEIDSAGAARF